MRRRKGSFVAWAAVLLVALALAAGHDAAASGGKPGPRPPGAKDGAEQELPSGCSPLADGHSPVVSPDGKRVAFGRGGTPPLARLTGSATPPDLWLRDVKARKDAALDVRSAPLAWTPDGTLLLEAGYGVETKKAAKVARAASLPAGAAAIEVAWTRDGKRLAWVPRAPAKATTTVQFVATDGKVQALAGTEGVSPDQAAFLAWSPDGASLFVNALFRKGSEVPTRRVGVADVATGELRVLATMPDWIGIPGLHAGEAIYRDPRVEGRSEEELDWDLPTGPRWGRDVWSADSRLVTWLAGTGWIEADAFVGDRTTGEVWRVTNDGDVKWSPALDPAGRRLAYVTADAFGPRAKPKDRRIRVLDLRTGEPTDLPLPGDGIAGSLAWTPGAWGVVYDLRDGAIARAYAQTVPAAKAAPKDAGIRRLEFSPSNRIIAWLGSYDPDRVHTAIHRAEDGWDDVYVPALRETLLRWKDDPSFLVPCLVHLLERRKVRDAVPELRVLLTSAKEDATRIVAARALLTLGEGDVADVLEELRTKGKDESTRLDAALALVHAGDDRGWPDIAKATTSAKFFTRRNVARSLGAVRQAKSVDLLIPMVGDVKQLSQRESRKLPPEFLVGRVAQESLRLLTGKSLGDDPAVWKAWWTDEAKGVLPDVVEPDDGPIREPTPRPRGDEPR